MSNAYDNAQTDKEMGKRLQTVFGDPKRHKFQSEADGYRENGITGRRGGRLPARKTVCFHCRQPHKGHAEVTEDL